MQLGLSPACQGKVMEVQARSYYALEDYDQALLYIDKSLQAQPNMLGYYYRGIIYQAAGKKEEAIQDLETFLAYVQRNYKGPEDRGCKSENSQIKTLTLGFFNINKNNTSSSLGVGLLTPPDFDRKVSLK